MRNSWRDTRAIRLMIASLVLVRISGCAPSATSTVELPTSMLISSTAPVEPTLATGWGTYTSPQPCGYSISYPTNMEGTSEGANSWTLRVPVAESDEAARNFIDVSTIPQELPSGFEGAYNYDPAEAETLLNMQVGESKSMRDDPSSDPWFTYTRTAYTVIGDQVTQTYENNMPWEFSEGTKDSRHYLTRNDCTYLIGGYLDNTGSTQAGAIKEELYSQIIATFHVIP